MPNWCGNSLGIKGNNVQEVLDFIKGNPEGDDQNVIDFDKIIPMPKELQITAGSGTEQAIEVILYDKGLPTKDIKRYLEYEWVKEKGITSEKEMVEYLRSQLTEENLREGQQALDNIEKYGEKDWYGWSIRNWGTKWNACDSFYGGVSPTEAWIEFDTAWSPPCPVVLALSQIFPDREFILQYSEPGIGFKGEFVCEGGEITKDEESEWTWEEDEGLVD